MTAETLQLNYLTTPRLNRRRPKHPILKAIVRLTLLIVALGIVIGTLIRMGFIQEPEREIYVEYGWMTSQFDGTSLPLSGTTPLSFSAVVFCGLSQSLGS